VPLVGFSIEGPSPTLQTHPRSAILAIRNRSGVSSEVEGGHRRHVSSGRGRLADDDPTTLDTRRGAGRPRQGRPPVCRARGDPGRDPPVPVNQKSGAGSEAEPVKSGATLTCPASAGLRSLPSGFALPPPAGYTPVAPRSVLELFIQLAYAEFV
jgi:hypothetical protein